MLEINALRNKIQHGQGQNVASLYYCAVEDISPPEAIELEAVLDERERERYRRMSPSVASGFFQGRRMVKQVIAQLLEVAVTDVRFHYSENGKPMLALQPRLHFSISHCPTAIVVLVASCKVGVDVESLERHSTSAEPPWKRPHKFMHKRSALWVESAVSDSEKRRLFTLLWTLMESQVKLTDSSIFRASKRLAIDLHCSGISNSWGVSGVEFGDGVSADYRKEGQDEWLWRAYEGGGLQGRGHTRDIISLAYAPCELKLLLYQWVNGEAHTRTALTPIACSNSLLSAVVSDL